MFVVFFGIGGVMEGACGSRGLLKGLGLVRGRLERKPGSTENKENLI